MSELNSKLRKLILIIGAAALIFKLICNNKKTDDTIEEGGFQAREFDDLW